MENSINHIIDGIKNNMSFFIAKDDSFKIIIDKILQKFNENKVIIDVSNYNILDFNNEFSKVEFVLNIKNNENIISETIVLILKNSTFVNDILSYYRRAKEIYLVNILGLNVNNFIEHSFKELNIEMITSKQFNYLKDQLSKDDNEIIVEKELNKYGLSNIKELTKSQASAILNIIEPSSRRNKK